MSVSPETWDAFRRQMPIARRWAYFDHAAVAPISQPARAAILKYVEQAAEQGDTVWPEWDRGVEQLRDSAARLIGAELDEIALIPNTTAGINIVAEGFPWQAGDNVVTLADEFPSNQYPWMNLAERGVECRRLETDSGRLDLDRLAEACDARTRLVSLSWVGYATGYRHDLDAVAEVVHRRGALLFVDAIQGLGVFPLDVSQTPIDFLAADGHKWMLGPEGAGMMYVRREHLDRLRPLGVGWHSVSQAQDFTHVELNLKPSAERYEGGSQNMVGMIGLGASLDLLLELGAANIARRLLEVTDSICERLTALGCRVHSRREGEFRSGIVSVEVPDADPMAVRRHCLDREVVLSCRAGRLRISPHAYTNEEDIDRLTRAVRESR
jgi:selenocysteine lyase/cysteine desulfurase